MQAEEQKAYCRILTKEARREKGAVRKEVREVGEKSEVASGSNECQVPWEIKQNKKWEEISGFGWKDTADNFSVVHFFPDWGHAMRKWA